MKHEITDGRENEERWEKKSIRKMVGIKIKRTEAVGKQKAESYDSAIPSRPGNYWLNLEEKIRKREIHVFSSFALPTLDCGSRSR